MGFLDRLAQSESGIPARKSGQPLLCCRMTSSTPLRVKTPAGEQQEKFLFYRGVSTFPVPLSAKLTTAGKLPVENRSADEIPNTILLERRGEEGGYRIGGALPKEVVFGVPGGFATIDELCEEVGR